MSATARPRVGASVCRLAVAVALVGGSALSLARAAAEPAAAAAPRVLLINSYTSTTRWSVELAAGVRAALVPHFPQASLTVEHLTDDPQSADALAAPLAERLRQEHARQRFAVTIAADDAAFRFALSRHAQMLPGSPLVFCGVSDLPAAALGTDRLITGTVQVHDVGAVLGTALKRHPATRVLVVVHDLSPAGVAYREQVQSWTEDLQRRRPGMVVAFLSAAQYSTPELVEQIRVMPLDCLVLLTTWSQDRDRQPQQLDDVLARVARVSPVPVYGVSGSVSGFSTSEATLREAHQQGEAAGALAVKILQGVPPSEIPIQIVRSAPSLEAAAIDDEGPRAPSPPRAAFPGLDGAPLPRPLFLALAVVAALLQAALIGLLFVVLRRQGQTQRDLQDARQRTALIIDSANLAVLEWDLMTGGMAFNARYAERLGYLPEDIPPTRRQWETMVHPDDLPTVEAALQECLDDHRALYAVRYRLLNHSGTYRWVLERGEVSTRLPDGSPSRLLGVQTDGEPLTAPETAARQ